MHKNHLDIGNRRLLLLGALLPILFLSGCDGEEKHYTDLTPANTCNPAEINLTATLPPGSVDLSESALFAQPGEEKIIRSKGVYVEKNQVLTVSHALPRQAGIARMTELKRSEEQELLLFKADICGKALPLTAENIVVGNTLHDCTTGKKVGTVAKTGATTFSGSPLSSKTKELSGLLEVKQQFSSGDSGKPFCTGQGEIAGILVAIYENAALVIPAEQLRSFLN